VGCHHRGPANAEYDQLRSLLPRIVDNGIRYFVAVDGHADGGQSRGFEVLQGFRHSVRNALTGCSISMSSWKHMHKMQGRTSRLTERCRISDGVHGGEIEVGREDYWADDVCRSVLYARSHSHHRARRLAEDFLGGGPGDEALEAAKPIGPQDGEVDLLRCDRFQDGLRGHPALHESLAGHANFAGPLKDLIETALSSLANALVPALPDTRLGDAGTRPPQVHGERRDARRVHRTD